MLAKERCGLPVAKTSAGRRRRPEHVAEAVHLAAFQVHASEERSGNTLLAFAQQSMGLLGASDVAGEKNHPGRLDLREQGSERGDISVPSKPMMRSWPIFMRVGTSYPLQGWMVEPTEPQT